MRETVWKLQPLENQRSEKITGEKTSAGGPDRPAASEPGGQSVPLKTLLTFNRF